MKMHKHLLTCMLALNLMNTHVSAQSHSEPPTETPTSSLLLGLGVLSKQQIYKGADHRTIVVPVIGYQGQKLSVFGPFVKYKFLHNKQWTLEAHLTPRFDGFDEDDSVYFESMEKRKDSFDMGLNLIYSKNNWKTEIQTATDILSRSDGTELSLKASRDWRVNQWKITPHMQLRHWNSRLTNYYYGVRSSEATLMRPEYNASGTLNTSLGINVSHRLKKGLLRTSLNLTLFGSEITNSPLVDENKAISLNLFYIF